MAAVTAATLAYLGWDLLAVTSSPRARPPSAAPAAVATSPPPAETAPTLPPDTSGRVSYSFDVDEVAGLSPTAEPGTIVELWVTWDSPVVARPKLQRVVKDAVLEGIDPPVTADGPTVATFSIARPALEDLLWADRYGELSASTLPTTGAVSTPRS